MQAKLIQFKTKGMQKDLSESAFSSEFAFDNLNIRLSAIDNNTLFSLSNEIGTLDMQTTFSGYPIGHAVVDDKVVLFTADYIGLRSVSTIYLITITDTIDALIMYQGQLNFSPKYPIETLAIYESLNAIKVYWVDGINQPRVINIADYYKDNSVFQRGDTTLFDFVPTLALNEVCTVKKNLGASGTFSPGTIQYAFTYYNLHRALSNIFYTSSLFYISRTDRGGSPDERISNAFDIHLSNLDSNFNYVRIYSIHRSSIDATPTVRRVADLDIVNSSREETIKKTYASPLEFANGDSFIDTNNEYIATEGISERPLSVLTSYTGTSWANYFYYWGSDDGNYLQMDLNAYRNADNPVGPSRWLKFRGVTYYVDESASTNSWKVRLYYDGDAFSTTQVKKIAIISSTDSMYEITVNPINERKIDYVDDGESGDVIDPTELLFIGGKEIIAGTIALKDNTLFLGNIESKGLLVEDDIKSKVLELASSFSFINKKTLTENVSTGTYPYTNHLNKSLSEISTFMCGETYRIGLQFQKHTGEWTEPIFIGDIENNTRVATGSVSSKAVQLVEGRLVISRDYVNEFKKRYKRVRPMIVFPSNTDRTVICQGVLNPTVFNVSDRNTNSPYAQSSWFFRPNAPVDLQDSL